MDNSSLQNMGFGAVVKDLVDCDSKGVHEGGTLGSLLDKTGGRMVNLDRTTGQIHWNEA